VDSKKVDQVITLVEIDFFRFSIISGCWM